MAEMGFKCYRMSINWSRIYPLGYGKVNEEGLKFYDDLFDECLKYGIEPVFTLFHFETPLQLVNEMGGWIDRRCIELISAGTGEMQKRYGFVYVDNDDLGKETKKRYKKDSFYWYQRVIQSNGNDLGDKV